MIPLFGANGQAATALLACDSQLKQDNHNCAVHYVISTDSVDCEVALGEVVGWVGLGGEVVGCYLKS